MQSVVAFTFAHAVDACANLGQHSVTDQTVLVGSTCFKHTLSGGLSADISRLNYLSTHKGESVSHHDGLVLFDEQKNDSIPISVTPVPPSKSSKPKSCYKPLISSSEIRLLRLAPGKRNDLLNGELHHVKLLRHHQYEALSYEWGGSERTETINIQNGFKMHITESLYNALRDIRRESILKERVVWADAICINQNDLHERQQQISMMGTIYRKASRVITYMGPEKDDSSMAVEFAHVLWQYHFTPPDDRKHHMRDENGNIGLPPCF
jgi:hypothetical protein